MQLAPQTQADLAAQDATYYRGILHTLIDQGAALAARIHATATAATTPDSAVPEATIAFDRAARAVRRTIALARLIAIDPAATARTPAARHSVETRAATRTQLIRGVEDAIHSKHRDGAESLYAELAERLEDPALELDLQGRSVDEVIEEICRDLGVAKQGRSFIWKRRTPTDIASLRERAASSPGQRATLHLLHPHPEMPTPAVEPTAPPRPQPAPPRP